MYWCLPLFKHNRRDCNFNSPPGQFSTEEIVPVNTVHIVIYGLSLHFKIKCHVADNCIQGNFTISAINHEDANSKTPACSLAFHKPNICYVLRSFSFMLLATVQWQVHPHCTNIWKRWHNYCIFLTINAQTIRSEAIRCVDTTEIIHKYILNTLESFIRNLSKLTYSLSLSNSDQQLGLGPIMFLDIFVLFVFWFYVKRLWALGKAL